MACFPFLAIRAQLFASDVLLTPPDSALLAQLDQSLKAELKKYDTRAVETLEQMKEERKQLELSTTEAKARLAQLKDRITQAAQDQLAHIQELKTALEIQHATNEALESDIEAKERRLFGRLVQEWPEL